jgi:hypothetical protein
MTPPLSEDQKRWFVELTIGAGRLVDTTERLIPALRRTFQRLEQQYQADPSRDPREIAQLATQFHGVADTMETLLHTLEASQEETP